MTLTNKVRDIYASIVTADSLMLYAQGATDIYHAILPHVTKTEDERDELRARLEAAEKKNAQLKAEIKRQCGMVRAYRASAERYERERSEAVKRESGAHSGYRHRIRLLHERWSNLYYEQCAQVKALRDECDALCEMDKAELAATEHVCEVRDRVIRWLREAHSRTQAGRKLTVGFTE